MLVAAHNQFTANIRVQWFYGPEMFKIGYYIFACILYGMARSEDNATSTQCVAFALQPIHDHIDHFEKQRTTHLSVLATAQANMAQIQNVVLAFSSQLHELNEKLEQMETTLRKSYIPPGFDLIGTRYFYIEHYDRKNWTDAGIACQQKGGYLAAFKSQEELEELHKELQLAVYWLGINEREKEGQFVSVASGKAVEYFDWMLDEPFNWQDIKQECVALTLGKMTDVECSREFHYICQLDNKI